MYKRDLPTAFLVRCTQGQLYHAHLPMHVIGTSVYIHCMKLIDSLKVD